MGEKIRSKTQEKEMIIQENPKKPLPESIKKTVLDLAHKHCKLLPSWVQTFEIGYDHNGESFATCRSEKRYLRHVVEFESGIMGEGAERIELTLLHEICHAWTSPVYDAALFFMEDIGCSQEQLKVAKTILEHDLEMSTEGLSILLGELIKK